MESAPFPEILYGQRFPCKKINMEQTPRCCKVLAAAVFFCI